MSPSDRVCPPVVKAEALSITEAARQLGVSGRTIKRMIDDGKIPAFRTRGGHLRIPAESVRTVKGETPRAVSNPSSVLQNRPERVEELALEAQELRGRCQLERLRRDAATEEQRYLAESETLRRESEREVQAIALERERESREQAEAERRRRHESEQHQARTRFISQWIEAGLKRIPANAPGELQFEVRQRLKKALEACDISESEFAVQHLVNGIVADVLGPWQRRNDTAAIISKAVETLPLWVRGWADSPTEWALKAKQAASEAVSALPEGSGLGEIRTAAQAAVNAIAAEYQRQQNKTRYLGDQFLYGEVSSCVSKLHRAEEIELEPEEMVHDVVTDLRPEVRSQLTQELDGSETREQVSRRIRELVRDRFGL